MEVEAVTRYFGMTLEVLLLDLLLSSDNIIMIALACRSLPSARRRLGLVLGTGAAIMLRVLLTTVARFILDVPVLKLLGGLALVVIAVKLILAADATNEVDANSSRGGTSLWSAVTTIIVADLVMSVDNVLGLAAIARGSLFVLILGLLISVPLLMFGSLFVSALLQRFPILIQGGGAMLGWFAGDIAVSDPVFAGWIALQAPALAIAVPLLAAAYVLLQVRVMRETRLSAAALRPARQPRPTREIGLPRLPWLWRKTAIASVTNPPAALGAEAPTSVSARTGLLPASETPHHGASPESAPDRSGAPDTPPWYRRIPWPERSDWRIYERWSIGSLAIAGLLLFAMRPPKATGTVILVIALLGLSLAPKAQVALRRQGYGHAASIAVVFAGLCGFSGLLLILLMLTGWLGPLLR